MSIKDHNLPMLNSRNDWTDWINSIEDIAVRNDFWNNCDPEGIENLVFTVTKPPDSASKDTTQKYHSLQAIYVVGHDFGSSARTREPESTSTLAVNLARFTKVKSLCK